MDIFWRLNYAIIWQKNYGKKEIFQWYNHKIKENTVALRCWDKNYKRTVADINLKEEDAFDIEA